MSDGTPCWLRPDVENPVPVNSALLTSTVVLAICAGVTSLAGRGTQTTVWPDTNTASAIRVLVWRTPSGPPRNVRTRPDNAGPILVLSVMTTS